LVIKEIDISADKVYKHLSQDIRQRNVLKTRRHYIKETRK